MKKETKKQQRQQQRRLQHFDRSASAVAAQYKISLYVHRMKCVYRKQCVCREEIIANAIR